MDETIPALERLVLLELANDWGPVVVPRLALMPLSYSDDPGEGDWSALEPLEAAVDALASTLTTEQCEQLSSVLACTCVLALDLSRARIHKREVRQRKKNESRLSQAQHEAWMFAVAQWRANPDMRTGAMVKLLHPMLLEAGYADVTPIEKTLRDWLWYAPDNAKRRGRDRKQ
ncbi:MAG: hypothetical protein ACOH2I_00600 [Pseudomonas sp.]